MEFELQPLRIQAGWKIEYNNFTEYSIDIHGEKYCFELNEDLLRLTNEIADLTIDLGWYPAFNLSGSYLLMLVKGDAWDKPLEQVTTRSKEEVVSCIEKWVCYGCFSKYL